MPAKRVTAATRAAFCQCEAGGAADDEVRANRPCHLRRTAGMHARLPMTIRPARLDPKFADAAIERNLWSMWSQFRRAWIARIGGEAMSNVTLHVSGDIAGIYDLATRPEARGLGLARLLTSCVLDAARAQGATVAVLHSTPMAVELYRRLGFAAYGRLRLFAAPGT